MKPTMNLSQDLIPLSSKKISKKVLKKTKHLFPKYASSLPQCTYRLIFTPQRLLNPFLTHRLEGDLFLFEMQDLEKENCKGLIGNFNSCKRVLTSVYDKSLGTVNFQVESFESVITPVELVMERLDSLNDSKAHELAETVKYYGMTLDFLKRMSLKEEPQARNHSLYKDYKAKNKGVFRKHRDSCILSTRTRFFEAKNQFEVSELGFNERFVETQGVSPGEFIQRTMKKGFPDVIHSPGNYFEWYSQLLQMTGGSSETMKPFECILMAEKGKKPLECYVGIESFSLNMDGFIENTLFFILTPKIQFNQGVLGGFEALEEGKGILEGYKGELEGNEFLKTFYPKALKGNLEAAELGLI